MKNMIEFIKNEYDCMMFRFRDGITIIATVKEDDDYYYIYNPLKLEMGINADKKEFAKLVRWYPFHVTESCNTIIPKDDVILFQVSDSFKEYYVNRLEAINNPSKRKATVLKIGEDSSQQESSSNANIISFDNFKNYQQKKASLKLVSDNSSNTGGGDVA